LTRRAQLAEIERALGVSVAVLGRHYKPGMLLASAELVAQDQRLRPLFVCITPGDSRLAVARETLQQRCDLAVDQLRELSKFYLPPAPSPRQQHDQSVRLPRLPPGFDALLPPPPPPPPAPPAPAPPTSGTLFRCLYVGLVATPEFDAAARLRGPSDSYLAHIVNSAAAVVCELRGQGSGRPRAGPEPLHLFVSAAESGALEKAEK
jgi:hypothetical protein